MFKLNPDQMVRCLAKDLPDNKHILLDHGLPQQLTDIIDPARQISLSLLQDDDTSTTPVDISIVTPSEISEQGDLLLTGRTDAELKRLLNARYIVAICELFSPQGSARLLAECSETATKTKCVVALYTDIAVFEFTDQGVFIRELIEGTTIRTLQMEIDVELSVAPNLGVLKLPIKAPASST